MDTKYELKKLVIATEIFANQFDVPTFSLAVRAQARVLSETCSDIKEVIADDEKQLELIK